MTDVPATPQPTRWPREPEVRKRIGNHTREAPDQASSSRDALPGRHLCRDPNESVVDDRGCAASPRAATHGFGSRQRPANRGDRFHVVLPGESRGARRSPAYKHRIGRARRRALARPAQQRLAALGPEHDRLARLAERLTYTSLATSWVSASRHTTDPRTVLSRADRREVADVGDDPEAVELLVGDAYTVQSSAEGAGPTWAPGPRPEPALAPRRPSRRSASPPSWSPSPDLPAGCLLSRGDDREANGTVALHCRRAVERAVHAARERAGR
jgi:hypothetical protein